MTSFLTSKQAKAFFINCSISNHIDSSSPEGEDHICGAPEATLPGGGLIVEDRWAKGKWGFYLRGGGWVWVDLLPKASHEMLAIFLKKFS